ncbi:hypothetical protein AB0C13_23155 [Streptomyces sp. NPDC049099]|uniref:hypothetical protein n=1 Tax=Streptomyces sp. NPDC049099 TaxID=3155768 RepID=UPI00343D0CE2
MRLRTALLSLASAVTLVLSVSASARAGADGALDYGLVEAGGRHAGTLEDPDLNECINIPELGSSADSRTYADAPHNVTNAYADVYEERDCEGTRTTLAPDAPGSPDTLHFRSVLFRPAG